MAIYSLSASTVGRSTHAPGTAGAHLAYIGRRGAAEAIVAERMPDDVDQARTWIDTAELTLRTNARVITKFVVAIPAELTDPVARLALMRDFGAVASAGAAPWIAALHRPSREGDDRNFHAHVAIHDRHPVTGKTVAGLSNKGRLEELRTVWQDLANAHLERAGSSARIDARSLRDQGIEAARPVHLGPAATAMERRGVRTRVGDMSRASTALDAARTALTQGREELEVLTAELRAAKAREAWGNANLDLMHLQQVELPAAREAEAAEHARKLAAQRSAAAAEDARRAAAAQAEAAEHARQLAAQRSAAAAEDARRAATAQAEAENARRRQAEYGAIKLEDHSVPFQANHIPVNDRPLFGLLAIYIQNSDKDTSYGERIESLVKVLSQMGEQFAQWVRDRIQNAADSVELERGKRAKQALTEVSSWVQALRNTSSEKLDIDKIDREVRRIGGPNAKLAARKFDPQAIEAARVAERARQQKGKGR